MSSNQQSKFMHVLHVRRVKVLLDVLIAVLIDNTKIRILTYESASQKEKTSSCHIFCKPRLLLIARLLIGLYIISSVRDV